MYKHIVFLRVEYSGQEEGTKVMKTRLHIVYERIRLLYLFKQR